MRVWCVQLYPLSPPSAADVLYLFQNSSWYRLIAPDLPRAPGLLYEEAIKLQAAEPPHSPVETQNMTPDLTGWQRPEPEPAPDLLITVIPPTPPAPAAAGEQAVMQPAVALTPATALAPSVTYIVPALSLPLTPDPATASDPAQVPSAAHGPSPAPVKV
jgi:hypothetical protein